MTAYARSVILNPRHVQRDLEMEFDGSDGLDGVFGTYYDEVMPIKLRDLTLGQRATGQGTALRLVFPPVNSVNEVTAYVRDVLVRPHPTLGTPATWANGLFFEHCWNLRLDGATVHGDNARHAPDKDDPTRPFPLHTAIRFKGCQDVQARGLTLYGGMEVGVALEADVIGHGEGLLLDAAAIVGARCGIRIVSNLPGNLPTPWCALSHFHIYHHATGIMAVNRSELTIHDGNIYCSPQTESGVGIYIIGGRDVDIHDMTAIWNLSKHGGYGIYYF